MQVPKSTFSSATAEPAMEAFHPLDTAGAGHEPDPEDAAKPTVCYLDGGSRDGGMAATCRVYMYRDTAGTTSDMYTGWFVDPTHVVTAGVAVARGGTGKYNVFAVKGRYGIVCCGDPTASNIPAGGPDSCPQSSSFNIIKAVTTPGWLNKNHISNSGAVLKVVGLVPVAGTDLALYKQANPLCLTNVQVANSQWSGYPYPAMFQGCDSMEDGATKIFFASYYSASSVTGTLTCSPDVSSPYWTFLG
jgi:hypothetical protein